MALRRRRGDDQARVRRRASRRRSAYLMNRQRDAVGLIAFDDRIAFRLPAERAAGPPARAAARARAARARARAPTSRGRCTSWPRRSCKRGLVVLISDLLDDPEPVDQGAEAPAVPRHRRPRVPRARSARADVSVRAARRASRISRARDEVTAEPASGARRTTCEALAALHAALRARAARRRHRLLCSTPRSRSTSRCWRTCRRARGGNDGVSCSATSRHAPGGNDVVSLSRVSARRPGDRDSHRAAPAAARRRAGSAVHRRPPAAPRAGRACRPPAPARSPAARGARRRAAAPGRGVCAALRAGAAPAPLRVVAIDRSFSMGAPGVFARALELARQAIDEARAASASPSSPSTIERTFWRCPAAARRRVPRSTGSHRGSARRATVRSSSRRSIWRPGRAGGWSSSPISSARAGKASPRRRFLPAGRSTCEMSRLPASRCRILPSAV